MGRTESDLFVASDWKKGAVKCKVENGLIDKDKTLFFSYLVYMHSAQTLKNRIPYDCRWQIRNVNYMDNTCVLSRDNFNKTMDITDVVTKVINVEITVNNPSALRGWKCFTDR